MAGNVSKARGDITKIDQSVHHHFDAKDIKNLPVIEEKSADAVQYSEVLERCFCNLYGVLTGESDVNTYKFAVEGGKTYYITGSYGHGAIPLYVTANKYEAKTCDFDLSLDCDYTQLVDYEVTMPGDCVWLYVHCATGHECAVFEKINRFEVNEDVLDPKLKGAVLASVATVTERDAIKEEMRFEGMEVYCEDAKIKYRLVGGITNDCWVDKDTIPDGAIGGGKLSSDVQALLGALMRYAHSHGNEAVLAKVTEAIITAAEGAEQTVNKGMADGYAALDKNGLIFTEQIPESIARKEDSVEKLKLFNEETVTDTETDTNAGTEDATSLNLLNPDYVVANTRVNVSSFVFNSSDNSNVVVFPVEKGKQYMLLVTDAASDVKTISGCFATGTFEGDVSTLEFETRVTCGVNNNTTYAITPTDTAKYLVFNDSYYTVMIYDYSAHGLQTEYVEYVAPDTEDTGEAGTETEDTTDKVYKIKPELITVDTSLTEAGKPADAKAVGDALNKLGSTYYVTTDVDGKAVVNWTEKVKKIVNNDPATSLIIVVPKKAKNFELELENVSECGVVTTEGDYCYDFMVEAPYRLLLRCDSEDLTDLDSWSFWQFKTVVAKDELDLEVVKKIDNAEQITNKGKPGGYPPLNDEGKIEGLYLPESEGFDNNNNDVLLYAERNLIDLEAESNVSGYAIYSGGPNAGQLYEASSQNSYVTDYIPLVKGNKYVLKNVLAYAIYEGVNYVFKEYVSLLWETGYVNCDTDNQYIRICFSTENKEEPYRAKTQQLSAVTSDEDIPPYYRGTEKRVVLSERMQEGIMSTSVLNGLKVAILGDSTSSEYGDKGAAYGYTLPIWHQYLAQYYGIVPTNYSYAGTTMTHSVNGDGNEVGFVDRYTSMADDADVVIVMGGINDALQSKEIGDWNSEDTATVYGALNVLIKGLLNKYPKGHIIFATPNQLMETYLTLEPMDGNTTHANALQNVAQAIINKCKQYSVPCCDIFGASGITGVYDTAMTEAEQAKYDAGEYESLYAMDDVIEAQRLYYRYKAKYSYVTNGNRNFDNVHLRERAIVRVAAMIKATIESVIYPMEPVAWSMTGLK